MYSIGPKGHGDARRATDPLYAIVHALDVGAIHEPDVPRAHCDGLHSGSRVVVAVLVVNVAVVAVMVVAVAVVIVDVRVVAVTDVIVVVVVVMVSLVTVDVVVVGARHGVKPFAHSSSPPVPTTAALQNAMSVGASTDDGSVSD